MIGLPPFEAGAVHEITDLLSPPELAATEVGAPGNSTVFAVAELDEVDGPTAFVAITVKV